MRVKDLVRWVDSFGLPNAPWAVEAADWATVLNLLSRLVHQQLAERVEMEEKKRQRRRKSAQKEEGKEAEKEIREEGKKESEEGEKEESEEGEKEEAEVREKEKAGEVGKEIREEGKKEAEEGEKDEEEEQDEGRRESTSSRHHPSTQLSFQQALHLAECALGAPQMTVLADTKTGAEVDNQLSLFVTLCSLRFAMGATETKPFRDFQFSFRIYFDMDSDESSRLCASCGELVHLIERLILNGRVWHRSCLKCAICGRQLYRGAFHRPTDRGMAFECVEHFANRVLYGNPKHRLALPPSRHLPTPSAPEKRLSVLSIASSTATPPPRPPPPKATTAATNQGQKQNDAVDEESIEKKIASATAARHDAPTPKPRKTKPMPLERGEANSSSSRGTEKDTACCWEVLKYPEELNPFGSEDEADDDDGKNPFGDSASSSGESELILPGEEKKQQRKSSNAENEEEEEPEEVQNPQDRVQTCSSAADEESSACPSPARAPPMVQIVTAGGTSPAETEEKPSAEDKQTANTLMEENVTMPETTETPENKTPNKAQQRQLITCEQQDNQYQYDYIPPLAPMLFRGGGVQLRKFDVSRPLAPSAGDDSAKQYQQQQQQHLYELDTRLRKLHAQLDQWEITGARMEGQMLREMGNKEKTVWKKGGTKLANEYAYVVEQRLTALSLEAQLVRRYMDTFLEVAHAELDGQMKAAEKVTANVSDNHRLRFAALLAQLLHMRNELTELERRERSGRTNAVEESERKRETEKTTKREAKREKEEKMEETDKRGAEEKKNSVEETAEKVPTDHQQKKRTMLKMRGVKQSLVNTLRKKL
ncbi:hypothetical protein niasHT_030084 [Heterodera trifolii]|uniref:LIM zinc-binding domain-containing protein n=1 Tax=Heterodera trifolii TaxID=157864 RepID=A0ABD2JG68_9BILA